MENGSFCAKDLTQGTLGVWYLELRAWAQKTSGLDCCAEYSD
jgi:hypothetical protein